MVCLEKAMLITLEGLINNYVVIHANDLCIYSYSEDQH